LGVVFVLRFGGKPAGVKLAAGKAVTMKAGEIGWK
jgi:hypothetical protein